MSAVTYVVLALVVIVVIGAAYIVYNDRRKGKNSCGCNCSECGTACASPMVDISEETGDEAETVSEETPSDPEDPEEKVEED